MGFKQGHYLMELYFFLSAENGLQLAIQIDMTPVIRVLESVLLDVLPERSHNASSSFLFYAEHSL